MASRHEPTVVGQYLEDNESKDDRMDFHDSGAYSDFENGFRSRKWRGRKHFLDSVVATANTRTKEISEGQRFWRAQMPPISELLPLDRQDTSSISPRMIPCKVDRMKPLEHKSREGRVNRKNIPCLYVATDGYTAKAEQRGWIGSYMCVAQFITTRNLKLVDCTMDTLSDGDISHDQEGWDRFLDFTFKDTERFIWGEINDAFSNPVTLDDDPLGYKATQAIANTFRENHFDGLIYRSKVSKKGMSIALFDLNSANVEIWEAGRPAIWIERVVDLCFDFDCQ